MHVFIDIGDTLATGLPKSPGRTLCGMLKLDAFQAELLQIALFTTNATSPECYVDKIYSVFPMDRQFLLRKLRELWEDQLSNTRLIPRTIQTLQQLRTARIPVRLVSNIWPPFYLRFSSLFDLKHGYRMPGSLADITGFSGEAHHALSYRMGCMKPYDHFYEKALALGDFVLDPANVVMVGDSYQNDIAPAARVGMKTVWIPTPKSLSNGAIAGVLNGTLPAPTATLASITELTPEFVTNIEDMK